jgi:hypothetical protein
VVGELRRLGIRFYVTAANQIAVRQFGRIRVSPGDRFLTGDVFVFTGDRVRETPLLASRVALVEGLTPAGQRELADLRARITERVLSGKLHLNARGRQAQQRGALVSLPVESSPAQVGDALFRIRPVLLGYYTRDFDVLVREHLLVADAWAGTFRRYVELQERWDNGTAAVFLRPLPLPKLPAGAAPAAPPSPVAGG